MDHFNLRSWAVDNMAYKETLFMLTPMQRKQANVEKRCTLYTYHDYQLSQIANKKVVNNNKFANYTKN